MASRSDRRLLILNAAAACFARYGYAKTTLDDIGRAAGLNKASLYYYFPNKDELFIQVVLRESTEFQQELAAQVRDLADPAERLRHYLVERLRYYRQVLDQHELSLSTLQELEPRFDRLYADVKAQETAFVAELLAPLMPPTLGSTASAAQVAGLLLTVADALKHEAARRGLAAPPAEAERAATEATTRLLTDLLLAGLRAGGQPALLSA